MGVLVGAERPLFIGIGMHDDDGVDSQYKVLLLVVGQIALALFNPSPILAWGYFSGAYFAFTN